MTVLTCFIVAGLLVICDQLAKLWAVAVLAPVGSIQVIEGLLNLTYVENRGAAFGILHGQRFLLVSVTFIILGVICWLVATRRIVRTIEKASAALILAGGLGNLIDRLFRGFVVDYIDINPLFRYPMFNLADCCVVIGAVMMVLAVITQREEPRLVANPEGEQHAD